MTERTLKEKYPNCKIIGETLNLFQIEVDDDQFWVSKKESPTAKVPRPKIRHTGRFTSRHTIDDSQEVGTRGTAISIRTISE